MTTKLAKFDLTLYVNDVKVDFESIYIECGRGLLTYKYILNENNCGGRVKLVVDSSDEYVQVTFKCDKKHISIVNLDNKSLPIIFDGFAVNESQTAPFVLTRFNNEKMIAGNSVRTLVDMMETPTEITMYINEALVPANMAKRKWYWRLFNREEGKAASTAAAVRNDFWKLDLLNKLYDADDNEKLDNSSNDEMEENACNDDDGGGGGRVNNTQWIPVGGDNYIVGKLLRTIKIVFVRRIENKTLS
uniref:Ac17 n=1 Tax=Malacosoma sp. alphabaculovirus TaxID=1881632 RepID=A0A1B1V5S6_9ABAC|nr:ac17 [Malacosoma sp. alphabaculovirus]ANW12339.1 ac17 [Malacosoma sp. alphabaculovirus]